MSSADFRHRIIMSQVILVTGATGKQGGAVVNALLSQKTCTFTILAVTRDASSSSAKRLASKFPSIKLVQGNLEKHNTHLADSLHSLGIISHVLDEVVD